MEKKNNLFNDNDLMHAEVADDLLETMNEEVVELEDEIYELKQQLAEKDKEIEELKAKLKSQKLVTDVYSTIAGSSATKMSIAKEIRHQVCEEIREKLFNAFVCLEDWYKLQEILYQIEGENK